MNRQQRRVANKNNKKVEVTENQADIFMYTYGLVIKVLHEQWGWSYIRLGRLTEQLLEEYKNNNMTAAELQQWCVENIGIKLPL